LPSMYSWWTMLMARMARHKARSVPELFCQNQHLSAHYYVQAIVTITSTLLCNTPESRRHIGQLAAHARPKHRASINLTERT
jgi:hypothetical protein